MADSDPSKMKVSELRDELTKRGLSTKGLKGELVDRLNDALKNEEFGDYTGNGNPENEGHQSDEERGYEIEEREDGGDDERNDSGDSDNESERPRHRQRDRDHSDDEQENSLKRERAGRDSDDEDEDRDRNAKREKISTPTDTSVQSEDAAHTDQTDNPSNIEPNKIFVGGLHWEADENDLRRYFGAFGRVEEVSIQKHRMTGNSRGFGFVLFADDESMQKVFAQANHSIRDRPISVKPAQLDAPQPASSARLFINGLANDTNEDELRKALSAYGTLIDLHVLRYPANQQVRGFAFATYQNVDMARKALEAGTIVVGGRQISIEKAVPKAEMQRPPRFPFRGRGGFAPSFPRGGGGFRGGFRPPPRRGGFGAPFRGGSPRGFRAPYPSRGRGPPPARHFSPRPHYSSPSGSYGGGSYGGYGSGGGGGGYSSNYGGGYQQGYSGGSGPSYGSQNSTPSYAPSQQGYGSSAPQGYSGGSGGQGYASGSTSYNTPSSYDSHSSYGGSSQSYGSSSHSYGASSGYGSSGYGAAGHASHDSQSGGWGPARRHSSDYRSAPY